jgi:hypothetical protein
MLLSAALGAEGGRIRSDRCRWCTPIFTVTALGLSPMPFPTSSWRRQLLARAGPFHKQVADQQTVW